MSDPSPVFLILGGARSGKSRRALAVAQPWLERGRGGGLFVATAEPFDPEMRQRIEAHREERPSRFRTVEAPLDPATTLRQGGSGCAVAVLDCLTVWLGNLLHHRGTPPADTRARDAFPEVAALLALVERPPCPLIVVSNEVGLGVVPDSELGRHFRDLAGALHQEIAARATRVELMVAGLPLPLGGSSIDSLEPAE